jgi:high mobility group protein B2
MWRAIDDDERKPYLKKYAKDKERYEAEMEHYTPPDSDSDEPETKKKKRKKVTGGPKRALSSYMHFVSKQRAVIVKENPELKFAEIAKKLGSTWKTLSPEDKKPYEDKAAVGKAKYQEQMAAFKRGESIEAPAKKVKKTKPVEPEPAADDDDIDDGADDASGSGDDADDADDAAEGSEDDAAEASASD